jgi:prolyl oligopeptidase
VTAADIQPGPAPIRYPIAHRDDVIELLHGHRVADPYRWLEDAGDRHTRAWSAAQDELSQRWLDRLPGRDVLAGQLRELSDAGSVSVPVWRAGRAFRTRRGPGQEHPVLLVRDRPDAAGHQAAERDLAELDTGVTESTVAPERALLDVSAIDPTGSTTLDGWVPSRDGERLAYLLSTGGDEESELSVMDVTSGELVDGPIPRTKYTSIAWLPGGEGFYYVRRLPAAEVPDGEDQFHRRVWLHLIGTDPARDRMLEGPGLYADPTFYFEVAVSRDGRWLLVTASPGTAPRDSLWIADLHGDGTLTPVLTQADAVRCAPWVDRDGRLYLLTTMDAPRWRLCVTDPGRPHPAHWTELIAQQPDAVLGAVRWLDPASESGAPLLAAAWERHATGVLTLHRPSDGARVGQVPLPGTGSLTGMSVADTDTPAECGRIWVGWTDPATPPQVHRFELDERRPVADGPVGGRLELLERAPGAVTPPRVSISQVEFASADGTAIRMFLVAPGTTADRPRPALLTGYGGFAVTREPSYSSAALSWVAAGGVYGLVSLRGGGEEGEEWHRAGMRERKQNVFDDFHAAAGHLIESGWTTPDQLAIMGGSNGGLLVGAALTQRPELYRAVVCSAPLLDMVRYERFLLGRTWNDEYGTAADPDELAWLLSYSPYHHVRPAARYPSVLFTVFDSDSRVDPAHARKMAAALQHATSGSPDERPILLRRETEVGHSARSVSRSIALAVDQLAFLADAVGLSFGGGAAPSP